MFCKLAMFLVLMGLSKNFSVRASKSKCHDKYHKASQARITPKGLQNIANMKSRERLAKSDKLVACDSILQIGHYLGSNGFN